MLSTQAGSLACRKYCMLASLASMHRRRALPRVTRQQTLCPRAANLLYWDVFCGHTYLFGTLAGGTQHIHANSTYLAPPRIPGLPLHIAFSRGVVPSSSCCVDSVTSVGCWGLKSVRRLVQSNNKTVMELFMCGLRLRSVAGRPAFSGRKRLVGAGAWWVCTRVQLAIGGVFSAAMLRWWV